MFYGTQIFKSSLVNTIAHTSTIGKIGKINLMKAENLLSTLQPKQLHVKNVCNTSWIESDTKISQAHHK